MEMLAGEVEVRALRDGDAGANQGTWLDRVFAGSAAQRLGVSFRNVAPGVAAYPITSAGGTPVQRGRTQTVGESTYTVKVTEIKPSRAAVHGIYSIEDDARLPGIADAIERDMRMAMREDVDRTIFIGDDGANEDVADIVGFPDREHRRVDADADQQASVAGDGKIVHRHDRRQVCVATFRPSHRRERRFVSVVVLDTSEHEPERVGWPSDAGERSQLDHPRRHRRCNRQRRLRCVRRSRQRHRRQRNRRRVGYRQIDGRFVFGSRRGIGAIDIVISLATRHSADGELQASQVRNLSDAEHAFDRPRPALVRVNGRNQWLRPAMRMRLSTSKAS